MFVTQISYCDISVWSQEVETKYTNSFHLSRKYRAKLIKKVFFFQFNNLEFVLSNDVFISMLSL